MAQLFPESLDWKFSRNSLSKNFPEILRSEIFQKIKAMVKGQHLIISKAGKYLIKELPTPYPQKPNTPLPTLDKTKTKPLVAFLSLYFSKSSIS